MQIHELAALSGNPASGNVLAIDTGSVTRKIDYTALAKAIVEQYNGSTLAGSAQTLQAAINALNTAFGNAVRYDTAQTLTDAQKTQARTNISAASIADMADAEDNLDDLRGIVMRALPKITGTGAEAALDGTVEAPLAGLVLYGKAVQNGTPTPTSPVAIDIAGAGGTLNVASVGKNLLPTFTGGSTGGLTFTVGSDGSVKVTGTNSGTVFRSVQFTLSKGSYILSGAPTGGQLTIRNANGGGAPSSEFSGNFDDYGSGASFSVSATASAWLNIRVVAGTHDDTYYPMIRRAADADATYEPYAVATTPVPVPSTGLPGIKVSSGGNYTDESGQRWICDTIDMAAGTYTQRVAVETFSGGTNCFYNGATTLRATPAYTIFSSDTGDSAGVRYTYPCNRFVGAAKNTSTIASGEYYPFNSGTGFVFYNESGAADNAQARAWFAANPVTVAYAMATPVVTALTDAQLTALKSILSHDGATTLYTTSTPSADLTASAIADVGKLIESIVAPDDDDMTADASYAVNSFFTVGGTLYRATAAIATGETIIPGTNCVATTIADQLTYLYSRT